MPVWNATRFCKLLAGRRMLFVGDSTMQQTASVVMSAVSWPYHTKHGGTADSEPIGRTGSCASQLTFGKSDTLIGRPLGRLNRGKPWHEWVNLEKPAIVVLSAGAHVYGHKNFTSLLREVSTQLGLSMQVLHHEALAMALQRATALDMGSVPEFAPTVAAAVALDAKLTEVRGGLRAGIEAVDRAALVLARGGRGRARAEAHPQSRVWREVHLRSARARAAAGACHGRGTGRVQRWLRGDVRAGPSLERAGCAP